MTRTKTLPFLDRLLSWSLKRALPISLRYAAATELIVAVGSFRALVISSIVPWLLFIPVVLAIALFVRRQRNRIVSTAMRWRSDDRQRWHI